MTMRRFLNCLCLLACLWMAQPAHAQVEMFKLATVDDVPSRIDINYEGGRGLGFERGYTQLDTFIPFYQNDDLVLVSDARALFFDKEGIRNLNLGVGARTLVPTIDRMVGLNAFYDNFDSGLFTYHQLGVGYEVLGDYFDLRGNFYLPLSDNRKTTSVFDVGLGFQGFNIIQSRQKLLQVSQRGADVEIGVTLPSPETVVSRASVGYYNYQGEGARQIQGIRGRFEASVLDMFTIQAVVENDRVYKTTAYGGIGFRFGGPSSRDAGRVELRDRRADPIVRNPNIVIRPETERATPKIELKASTAQPFRVIHVDSAALPGGNGSFERPFQTLAQAQTGSMMGDIIFAHAGSVLTGANFTLQNNQSFFGEGVTHILQSIDGPLILPRATANAALPIRQIGVAQTGVTLAQNNEVSGIDFRGAMNANGILGTGNVGFFNINRNTFSGFTGVSVPPNFSGAGVSLRNASGAGLITNNTFLSANYGVLVFPTLPSANLRVGIRDNKYGAIITNDTLTAVTNGVLGVQYLRNTTLTGRPGTTLIGLGVPGTVLLEPLVGNTGPIIVSLFVTPVPANSLGLP